MAAARITAMKSENKNLVGKVHLMPCGIKYSGEANVEEYFETCIREQDGKSAGESDIKQASFRGRPLKGKEISVPSNYKGVVLKEEKKPITDDKERKLVPQMMFTEINYWNLDANPSENDNIAKALKWINISKALHGQNNEGDADDATQQTQTDR